MEYIEFDEYGFPGMRINCFGSLVDYSGFEDWKKQFLASELQVVSQKDQQPFVFGRRVVYPELPEPKD